MCLFDLCLVVSSKMGKTKAKREPYKDFNPRDRYSISTWRKVKALYLQGLKRTKIEEELDIRLHKRTFNRNMKKSYDNRDVNSRKHNRSHKGTDGSEMVEFKQETVRLFNKKTVMALLVTIFYQLRLKKFESKTSTKMMKQFKIFN